MPSLTDLIERIDRLYAPQFICRRRQRRIRRLETRAAALKARQEDNDNAG